MIKVVSTISRTSSFAIRAYQTSRSTLLHSEYKNYLTTSTDSMDKEETVDDLSFLVRCRDMEPFKDDNPCWGSLSKNDLPTLLSILDKSHAILFESEDYIVLDKPPVSDVRLFAR